MHSGVGGHLAKDWRRLAITELASARSNGYLIQLPYGTEIVGRSAPDACAHCKRLVDGKRYTVVDPNKPDKDWETEVWVGKTNLGRSLARRKIVDARTVEREAHELGMPTIPLHPFCRCRWVRVIKGLPYDPRSRLQIDHATRAAADRMRARLATV